MELPLALVVATGCVCCIFIYCYIFYVLRNIRIASLVIAFKPKVKGLSPLELEKLPRITGKELEQTTECPVCLDDIESDQPARLLPDCNHAFHLQCVDTWLSKNPHCPVCRANLRSPVSQCLC